MDSNIWPGHRPVGRVDAALRSTARDSNGHFAGEHVLEMRFYELAIAPGRHRGGRDKRI